MSKYNELVKGVDSLPKEAIERAKKEVTRKGYDTTGYQYQFLVNVINEVIGLGNWGFTYDIIKEIEGKWNNGKSFWELTTKVTVWMNAETKAEFSCVGGHKSEMYADALKGAITNGFKKTVAFFGVGKKAYEGTVDDDYRPQPVEDKTPKEVKQPQEKAPNILEDILFIAKKKGFSRANVEATSNRDFGKGLIELGKADLEKLFDYINKKEGKK